MVAEQRSIIESIFAGLEDKSQVLFAAQGEQNEKVQQQRAQAEKMLKEIRNAAANTGGAGTLRGPKIRKEDCNVEKLKESADMVDFRQWVRTLELSLEAHYDWTFADLVFQAIWHEKAPITHPTFAELIVNINKDGELRDSAQIRMQPSDGGFDEKTRLLYRY